MCNLRNELVIGLCDDDLHIYERMKDVLLEYNSKNNILTRLYYYNSAEQLLMQQEKLDVLFLDIDMPKMSGIEAAAKLQCRGIDYKIVMLSVREDKYRDAFRIGAFRFVPKPIEKKELFRALDDVQEHMAGMEKIMVFRDGITYPIMQRDIIYIVANQSVTWVYTSKSEYRSKRSLVEWNSLLDKRIFFQCHKSYIVNMAKIDRIDKNIIYLVTGDRVNVSRRLRTDFLHSFMQYDTMHR